MHNLKTKTKVFFTILLVFIFMLPIMSFATNNEMVVVDKENGNYVIYINGNLTEEFEFAFSNNKDESSLTFYNSAKDSEETSANNVAYVDNTVTGVDFNQKTYLWLRKDGEIKITAREISIADNVTETELKNVEKVSKIIEVTLGEEETKNETDEEGVKVTVKVGSAKIKDDNFKELSYCLVPRTQSEETENLYALAELINKNNFTNAYTQIKASKEFIALYNSELEKINQEKKWNIVENLTILQPEEAKTGDQYILFLLKDGKINDAHFLTSVREENEEIVNEKVVSKLPVTYDNNTLLIVIAIQIIAIVLVALRIKMLKNKKEN